MGTKFSIVIPTYNRAHTVVKAINSVLNQLYNNYEIIVVDDGSTDNTAEAVNSIKNDKLFYYKKENGERASARNYGTKVANGDYVTFLDSDDLLYDNHLQAAAQLLGEKNNPEAIHLGYEIKDTNGNIILKAGNLPSPLNKLLIRGNVLGCCGVFLRKDIALQNLFNEDRALSACEDWELWLRIASRYPIYMRNMITATMINHEGRSVLEDDYRKLINRFEVFLTYVLANKEVTDYYKGKLHILKASCKTYVALHIALIGNHRRIALKYLRYGIGEYPLVIFTRRFIAVLKHIIRNK